MKLIFDKDESNDVTVKIKQGTVAVDFTYIEMIKQLLESNDIENLDFNNLSEEEQERLENMLEKITDIFEEDDDADEIEEAFDYNANEEEGNEE